MDWDFRVLLQERSKGISADNLQCSVSAYSLRHFGLWHEWFLPDSILQPHWSKSREIRR